MSKAKELYTRRMTTDDATVWLRPTAFVDSDAPEVVAFARNAVGDETDPRRRAVALYYAIRDGVTYTPYCDYRSPETYRASAVLAKRAGFCVGKAALLAAAARAEGSRRACASPTSATTSARPACASSWAATSSSTMATWSCSSKAAG